MPALRGGWPVNQRSGSRQRSRKGGPGHRLGLGERAQLSAGAGELLGRRGGVCRREEPSSYEAGLRAHGSNQRFHRLLGHAVARALTPAPRLTGLDPAAPGILILQGWRRKGPPGTLSHKPSASSTSCAKHKSAISGRSNSIAEGPLEPPEALSRGRQKWRLSISYNRLGLCDTLRGAPGARGLRTRLPHCRPSSHQQRTSAPGGIGQSWPSPPSACSTRQDAAVSKRRSESKQKSSTTSGSLVDRTTRGAALRGSPSRSARGSVVRAGAPRRSRRTDAR
jgi:hypothetical protein